MKQIIILIFLLEILAGCSSKNIGASAIIGTWKNTDGGTILFKQDGTLFCINLPINVFFEFSPTADYSKRFDGQGIWKIIKDQGQWVIVIDINNTQEPSLNAEDSLILWGTGVLETSPPYNRMYMLVGDPDDNIRYAFNKQ
jgi:hypothetical protein